MDGSLRDAPGAKVDSAMRAMVSLTGRCPLACGHCYLSAEPPRGELSLAEIEAAFDALLALGTFQLLLSGGEPALRPDLEAIVAAAWKRRFVITLKTSGALLDRAAVGRLRESGLAALHVSLYHVEPAEHDRFVGRPGSWRRAVDALDEFHALGGMCTANMVVMGWNAGAVGAMVSLCRERGWSAGVDPKPIHALDGRDRAAALGADPAATIEAMRKVPEERQHSRRPAPEDPVCRLGEGFVYIHHDGEVWLCPVLPLSIGNVRERPLLRIWEESDLRRRLLAHTWGDSPKCMACALNRFCDRCPGEAYLEHGDWTAAASADCRLAAANAAVWESENRKG